MEILQEQSRLIDLAHDAIIVRNPQWVVRLWNQGAATLYGWTREEAVGKITHLLLKTKFPEPFEEVERKLMNQGEWSGELVHTARNGNQIIVASRQVLQRGDHGQPDRDSGDQPGHDPAQAGGSLPPVERGAAAGAGELHG